MDNQQVRRFAYVLFGFGVALLGEHIINHGYTEWNPLCHGTIGLLAIIMSYLLLRRKSDKSEDTVNR